MARGCSSCRLIGNQYDGFAVSKGSELCALQRVQHGDENLELGADAVVLPTSRFAALAVGRKQHFLKLRRCFPWFLQVLHGHHVGAVCWCSMEDSWNSMLGQSNVSTRSSGNPPKTGPGASQPQCPAVVRCQHSPRAHYGHSAVCPIPSLCPEQPCWPSTQHSHSAWGAHCNYFPVPPLPLGVTALMSWWRSCQPPPRCFATTGSCLHMWSNYRARRRMLPPSTNVIPPSPGTDSLLCTSVGQCSCPWAGGQRCLFRLETNLLFLMDEMTASRPTSISFRALSSRGRSFCNGARFALGLEKGFLAAP